MLSYVASSKHSQMKIVPNTLYLKNLVEVEVSCLLVVFGLSQESVGESLHSAYSFYVSTTFCLHLHI